MGTVATSWALPNALGDASRARLADQLGLAATHTLDIAREARRAHLLEVA